jgi:hypothetical protein
MARFVPLLVFIVVVPLFLFDRAEAQPFKLAPAVAVEAEDFSIESAWKVLRNGQGNYMVDIIGFNHISGERLLSLPGTAKSGRATREITLPSAGKYRLWVRYEYPAFCETRFGVSIEQGGKEVFRATMGSKESLRYAFGDPAAKAQHDPAWGPEGLMDEVVTTSELTAGNAKIILEGIEQPQIPGVSANRNIDLVYLTTDLTDSWRKHYSQTKFYPILDAVRDTIGPRWEARFTNTGKKSASLSVRHVYNRVPWGRSEQGVGKAIEPGKSGEWFGLREQDTSHFSMVEFSASESLAIEIRPVGTEKVARKLEGTKKVRVYLPPYPGAEQPTTPEEAIETIRAELAKSKAPGKVPTQPLCFGGWVPLGGEDDYARRYAQLYADLGFRSLHPANEGPAMLTNLKKVGIEPSKSWMVTGYRNPPTKGNIEKAKGSLARSGLREQLRFFDYGDEIAFSEWFAMKSADDLAMIKAAGKKLGPAELLTARWLEWIKAHRPDVVRLDDLKIYWRESWGLFNPALVRPDSSALAAVENPRLYVDSLLFYEQAAIAYAASGAKLVKAEFGDDVLCGANYSCHPFYYPHSTMYIKWFRSHAADLGRHSEYFWQVAQAGPMINGYIAEHFRAGLRDTPNGVLRQYTMPHSPGNTDGNFQRTAFSHLAHGATMLDFFGVGLNESFTENHIDHRDIGRFRALRDVTHCVGFVEDLLPKAKAVPSSVALLVSESTERWDWAGVAEDKAGHAYFGANFRKSRLHFHLERLGLWKALTFAGASPDLVLEEDVIAGKLDRAKLLVLVGDHWPTKMNDALKKFVESGGVIFSTAATGLKDLYGNANEQWHELAGLREVTTQQKVTFLRPRQELPYLKPLGEVVAEGWKMPRLATIQNAKPSKDTKVLAKFDDGTAAVFERSVGKGKIIHVAAHPGLAFLWSGLQPVTVPDRGPQTHTIPQNWDKGAKALVESVLKTAKVEPIVIASPNLVDARLLRSGTSWLLPIANYHEKVGQKVTLTIRPSTEVKRIASASHGELKFVQKDGVVSVTLPKLGYGDVLRME